MKKSILLFITKVLVASSISVSYYGSSDYIYMKKAIDDTEFVLFEDNGDLENIQKVAKTKTVSMGVVQEDILEDLVKQNPQARSAFTIVTPLYSVPVVLITPKVTNINSFRDISSHFVAVDVEGSGDYYTFLKLQEKYLVLPEILNMKKNQSIEYLKNGRIDAVFYIGNLDSIKNIEDYKIISLSNDFKEKTFNYGKEKRKLSYMDKFLISTPTKVNEISKVDISQLIYNVLQFQNNEKLCGYNLGKTIIPSLKYLYFVCSQQVQKPKKKVKKRVQQKSIEHELEPEDNLYYENLEDIVIYSQAIKDKHFSQYNTSYVLENEKLKTAIKLIKDELREDPQTKIVIISKGNYQDSMKYLNFIYKKLKKAKIPRGNLIKKASTIPCEEECFFKTNVRFKIL